MKKHKFENWIATPIDGYPMKWFAPHAAKDIAAANRQYHSEARDWLKQFALNIGYTEKEFKISTFKHKGLYSQTRIQTPHFFLAVGHTAYGQNPDEICNFARVYEKREVVIEGIGAYVHKDTVLKQLAVLYRRVRNGKPDANRWCDLKYLFERQHRWFDLDKHR